MNPKKYFESADAYASIFNRMCKKDLDDMKTIHLLVPW